MPSLSHLPTLLQLALLHLLPTVQTKTSYPHLPTRRKMRPEILRHCRLVQASCGAACHAHTENQRPELSSL
ncbi:hypothetical protein E2C01_049809 [Portunus trituberculatus]|uniref:Secreted protein n=1 Tax=Portunus trituberculatus TaxID=210409 RepID=A0A5B7GH39_PORTR|nr:hypothetical protein [Portunus trituberculatus]